jgi:FkbM family methyltransferase
MLISEAYAQQNAELHQAYASYGSKGLQWAAYVAQIMREDGHKTLLDYGCGKGTLGATLADQGITIAEYDPAIPGKSHLPEPADFVICLDVLEHVEPEAIDDVLAHLASLTKRKLFFDICLKPAAKTLSDGRNAHLLVHNQDWWRFKLTRHFDIAHWRCREDLHFLYGEATPKGGEALLPKRRRMTPEVSAFIEMVRVQTAVYSDAMSAIQTVNLFEGEGDRDADLQILYEESLEDEGGEWKIRAATSMARKGVLARAKITPTRSEAWWKDKFAASLRICDWVVEGDLLMAVGTPKVAVTGVKVVGAMRSEDRWEQVRTACKRIPKRIAPAKAHKRKCILACYGPSIRDTMDLMKTQAQAEDADVFSVSGAHDFIIEHGLIPDYHVECDPRPHKADNIKAPVVGVKYLLGSGVSPVVFDKLEGADIALWHIATPEHIARFLNELSEPNNLVISGGGSVGTRAISLAYNMGYREFHIYGMDCSFGPDGAQWASKHAGKAHELVRANTAHGETFKTSLILLTYATDYIELIQRISGADLYLYGEGLLQSMVAWHAEAAARQGGVFVTGEVEDKAFGMVKRKNGFWFPDGDTQWSILCGQSQQVLEWGLEYCPGRGTVIQAGGNVGFLARQLATDFDRVITFEPVEENFRCLEMNVNQPNIEAHFAALGECAGMIGMAGTRENCGSYRVEGEGEVPMMPIDELKLNGCDLIILDVEGYEFPALLGAKNTISRYRPTIILEDKGHSTRYGFEKGTATQWVIEQHGYKIAHTGQRDVVLVPA